MLSRKRGHSGRGWSRVWGRYQGAFSLYEGPQVSTSIFGAWSWRCLAGGAELSPDKALCHGAGWRSRCRQNLRLWYWPTVPQTQMFLGFMPSCLASVAQSERRNSASNMKHQPRSDNLDGSARYDRVHCHLSPSICLVRCATTDWQDSLHCHLSLASAGSVTSTQQPAAEHGCLSFIFGSPRSQFSSLSRQGQ